MCGRQVKCGRLRCGSFRNCSDSTRGEPTWVGLPEAVDAEMSVSSVGITQHAAALLGGVGFVDACEDATLLVVGRPFAMVEGRGGTVTLVAPIDGEVIEVNADVLSNPSQLDDAAEDPANWIVKVEHASDATHAV
jgi:glycine cleavage system H protein